MADTDLIFAPMFVVGTIFVLLIAGVVWNGISPKLEASKINESSYPIAQGVNTVFGFFDGAVILMQIVVIIALIASVFFIDTHPVFFVVSLFVFVISIFLGGIYSQLWTAFEGNTAVNETITNQFSLTKLLMDNYAVVLTIIGFIFLIFLYGKSQQGGFR